jgi:hypothetical protein
VHNWIWSQRIIVAFFKHFKHLVEQVPFFCYSCANGINLYVRKFLFKRAVVMSNRIPLPAGFSDANEQHKVEHSQCRIKQIRLVMLAGFSKTVL